MQRSFYFGLKEGKAMKNNYFYKSESEQFAFYRIPKLLFTDSRYAGISVEAPVSRADKNTKKQCILTVSLRVTKV